MVHRLTQFGKWLSVFVIGLVCIFVLTSTMPGGGSGAGTGRFSYWFGAFFHVEPEASSNNFGSLRVEGNAAPRFLLWGNVSPAYKAVELEWEMFQVHEHKGRATLDLDQMTMVVGNKTTDIDEKSLSALIGFPTANPHDAEQVATLLRFLHAAGDGTLPPPNHHGHELSEPLPGHMQHFASGIFIPALQLFWIIGWSAVGIGGLLLRRRSSPSPPNRA